MRSLITPSPSDEGSADQYSLCSSHLVVLCRTENQLRCFPVILASDLLV